MCSIHSHPLAEVHNRLRSYPKRSSGLRKSWLSPANPSASHKQKGLGAAVCSPGKHIFAPQFPQWPRSQECSQLCVLEISALDHIWHRTATLCPDRSMMASILHMKHLAMITAILSVTVNFIINFAIPTDCVLLLNSINIPTLGFRTMTLTQPFHHKDISDFFPNYLILGRP